MKWNSMSDIIYAHLFIECCGMLAKNTSMGGAYLVAGGNKDHEVYTVE